jgi:pyroglutamyl-peptidase
MANIIISGFSSFKGSFSNNKEGKANPSEQVAMYMVGKKYGGDVVSAITLPVEFKNAAKALSNMIDEYHPHLVVSLGVSKADLGTRREDLNLETRGRNIMHAKNPDKAGYAPDNEVITPDGPEFYETMFALNGEELAKAMAENGVRARTSDDSGKYVCNDLIYRTAEKISQEGLPTKFGFIHMPLLEGNPDIPEGKSAMPMEEVVKGLELIIERV